MWVLVIVIMGCRLPETAEPGATAVPTVTPIPRPQYTGPAPQANRGNVFGQVMWNGSGAADLDLLLCQDFSVLGGCKGRAYTAVTNADGIYLFTDVEPGTYALAIRVFDSDSWLYITDGILSTAEITVRAGEILPIENQIIYKLDLKAENPADQSRIKSGSQTLSWATYPDADYYQVYLTPEKGGAIFVNERVGENQVTAEIPPINCDYRWSVEAFNSDGIKIAETGEFARFHVTEGEHSCNLKIVAPADGETVAADGIVLDWDPLISAIRYEILMWDDTDLEKTKVLNFVPVTESQFELNGALTPEHRYIWSVYAYDASGREAAASEVYDFTVTP